MVSILVVGIQGSLVSSLVVSSPARLADAQYGWCVAVQVFAPLSYVQAEVVVYLRYTASQFFCATLAMVYVVDVVIVGVAPDHVAVNVLSPPV